VSLYDIALGILKEAANIEELKKQRDKGRGKILGSAATMGILPAVIGTQVAAYDVGLKKLPSREGIKAIARHGKGSAKMMGKYIAPMAGAATLINEARYHIRKRKAD
jgi:hypothetical protein